MTIIERAIKILAPRAALLPVEAEHWVDNADDESMSYCETCAVKEVEKLLANDPNGEYRVSGGWGTQCELTPRCQTCGVTLSSTLLEYGVEAELEHFEGNGFRLRSADDCYSIKEVLEAGPYYEAYHARVTALAQRVVNRVAGVKKRSKAKARTQ